jgi:hypothetical protein
VPRNFELAGHQVAKLTKAGFSFENLRAQITAEVVMMSLARQFKARTLARQINRHCVPVFHKRLDIPVNSGDSERGLFSLSRL